MVKPAGALRAFWLPPMRTSIPQSSNLISAAPTAETESTTRRGPKDLTTFPTSLKSLRRADGVSQWTNVTTSTSLFTSRALSRACRSADRRQSSPRVVGRPPYSLTRSAKPSPKTPLSTTRTLVPSFTVLATAASSPNMASPTQT